jgi:hypothetical protein
VVRLDEVRVEAARAQHARRGGGDREHRVHADREVRRPEQRPPRARDLGASAGSASSQPVVPTTTGHPAARQARAFATRRRLGELDRDVGARERVAVIGRRGRASRPRASRSRSAASAPHRPDDRERTGPMRPIADERGGAAWRSVAARRSARAPSPRLAEERACSRRIAGATWSASSTSVRLIPVALTDAMCTRTPPSAPNARAIAARRR